MAPRLSGQTSIFGVVSFVSKGAYHLSELTGRFGPCVNGSLFWELRDKRNLKTLPFWPESLEAMLEYWYIERGLLGDKPASFPDVSLAAKRVGAQGMKGWGKDRLSSFSFPWSLACSSPVSRASSSPASPASESKRLRRRQVINYLRKFYRINEQNKLHELFPARNRSTSDLRNMRS